MIDTGPGSEASLGLRIIIYTRSGEREKIYETKVPPCGCGEQAVIYILYKYVLVHFPDFTLLLQRMAAQLAEMASCAAENKEAAARERCFKDKQIYHLCCEIIELE